MFRRARWLGVGVALGFGASVWAQRKVKTAADKYRPAGLAGSALGKARFWPARVRAALDEGRPTRRQPEVEPGDGLQRSSRP